jgi:hypothetical protein
MNLITKLAYNALTKTIQAIAPGGVSVVMSESYSGVYTPTISNTTNVAASTMRQAFFTKVNNVVTVYGTIEIDPTSGAAATSFNLSLPIASNLATSYDLSGVGVVYYTPVRIEGDSPNDKAAFSIPPGTATPDSNQAMYYSFSYTVK